MIQVTHQLWTASRGIARDPHLAKFFDPELNSGSEKCDSGAASSYKIKKLSPTSLPEQDDIVLGWGNKANTLKAKQFSGKYGLSYLRLEDGFIGYLGHPLDKSPRLSLIKDSSGIYYDARSQSDLEALCLTADDWFTDEHMRRANKLQLLWTQHGISKYNHRRCELPAWLDEQAPHSVILVVDQTFGDCSVNQGVGSKPEGSPLNTPEQDEREGRERFAAMLTDALVAHPNQLIVLKTHPDVIKGSKQGFLDITACSNPRVRLLGDDCSIDKLMAKSECVYTVTSQLGFEGLLYGLPVHCYGMPFYAGWGLTIDKQVCHRRRANSVNKPLSLAKLIAAALIEYPHYLNPETQAPCEVEDLLDWLIVQLNDGQYGVDTCYAFGFSLWKRAFIKPFIGRMAGRVVFIGNKNKLDSLIKADARANCTSSVLLWGKRQRSWLEELKQGCPVWFMEDGFIRSVGLGADLRRPSCLVIDRQGMYYAPDGPSDIVDLLNNISLNESHTRRAEHLAQSLVERAMSKYNVGQTSAASTLLDEIAELANLGSDSKSTAGKREIILVPGQFEQDQSIAASRGQIKTNLQLLHQVRSDYPQAYILYKEHPDLYSGVRPGALGEQAALQYADRYLSDVDIVSVLALCDRVCTITSLTGFEALLRHKNVTTYGSPFYAGWGLTEDALTFSDRTNLLSLSQLVYATLVSYPRYVDWSTGLLTTPERVIEQLSEERARYEQLGERGQQLGSSWWSRLGRKVKYFYQAYGM
ncbi:capsular polysaccharide biosynthesis protein [Shewanella violacea]|uniref:Capsule polysacchride export protein KpsC n=1 Tax=Shewanella violacea (strain JCM 10179 / CIP 106290 / LMG 19151 / DSS12) TaxID=637905 RepID=D4ZFZ9_SHEVD|nr:capsular polysaccharide biosynthesis protein [Shewanella violacea]BAJ00598.1 capsule polysacchride export protein KpsC [Shewanella violacea DSS12]